MRKHSEDIDWFFDHLDGDGNVTFAFDRGECQSCWEDNKEFLISSAIESCSKSKQRVIEDRKERLIERFRITKKDMEAIIDESIESPYLGIAETHYPKFDGIWRRDIIYGYRKRSELKEKYGYTDEYITENLQLISIDNSGMPVEMTELEWSSYLSTLVPRQGYPGYKKVETVPKKRRKAVRRKKK